MTFHLNKASSQLNEDLNIGNEVASFRSFEQSLERQLHEGVDATKTIEYLNGAAAAAVRQLVSLEQRKRDGIFFTGHHLAERLVSYVGAQLAQGASAFDPTCGAGDLLLAAAKAMKLEGEPQKILPQFSLRIKGYDMHESFVQSAKLRIRLMASLVSADKSTPSEASELLPHIAVRDSLNTSWDLDGTECLLLNPPFGQVLAPADNTWGIGRVQRSALFVDKALNEMKVGQHLVAILPDVLRSGSNYSHWRKEVASQADVLAVDSIGKFDSSTDVDVFLLHARKGPGSGEWPELENVLCETVDDLGELFTVRTGSLVAYREPKKGPWRPYLDCTNASAWGEITELKKRRFRGTVVSGPFVAVRRTSSPSDASRVVASVVTTLTAVAVENHLIVIQPKDGRIETCRDLVAYFQTSGPSEWLNKRIRCRHLTVTAVRSIPLNWK